MIATTIRTKATRSCVIPIPRSDKSPVDLLNKIRPANIMSDKTSKAITPSAAKVSIPIPNPSSTAEQ